MPKDSINAFNVIIIFWDIDYSTSLMAFSKAFKEYLSINSKFYNESIKVINNGYYDSIKFYERPWVI